eukprot:TRINITY_DN2585_c0_g2_i1.p1 TRINITY_DN2585_c0_g2~~TRINITY_DN2585_c0_g2_i1.p1  ORF type:complete len:290 (+),score=74.44 TRINITY_DN2585_c0_g2_i1:94-963(+)
MRLLLCTAIALCTSVGAAPTPQRIWPGGAPGDENNTYPPETDPDGKAHDVSVPTLTFFKAPNVSGSASAVVVLPGGGYSIVAYVLEGTSIAEWLNSIGVHAAVLKYRVPTRPAAAGLPPHWAPLQDAQRAVGIVRANAAEWGVRKDSVGVIGFSAGGNLAAHLSTTWRKRIYDRVDGSDDEPCRPDFTMLCYPWELLQNNSDPLSVQSWIPVADDTPPSWGVHAADDGTAPVANSLGWLLAEHTHGISPQPELHVYPAGGHGFGRCTNGLAVCEWPDRAADWLNRTGRL